MYCVVYGDIVFTKHKGYFGEKEECPNCHKVYSPAFVKFSTWAHFSYIPVFPIKTRIYKMCPVCGVDHELKVSEAKPLMTNENTSQSITPYAKHILKNRPKNRMFNIDKSYELWVKDNATNEDFRIATGLNKIQIKNAKKHRGLKRLEIIEVK